MATLRDIATDSDQVDPEDHRDTEAGCQAGQRVPALHARVVFTADAHALRDIFLGEPLRPASAAKCKTKCFC